VDVATDNSVIKL